MVSCASAADGRITFDEWLVAMSGRSNLLEQREERMQEKRRSMAQDKGFRSPSYANKTISATGGAGMGQLKEEEEAKEQSSSVSERLSVQQPAIVAVS